MLNQEQIMDKNFTFKPGSEDTDNISAIIRRNSGVDAIAKKNIA